MDHNLKKIEKRWAIIGGIFEDVDKSIAKEVVEHFKVHSKLGGTEEHEESFIARLRGLVAIRRRARSARKRGDVRMTAATEDNYAERNNLPAIAARNVEAAE